MLGEPRRRRPCWRGPQLLLPPGLIFLMIYSWLLIFSSLPGRTQADHEDVPTHNSSATATATATALAPINSAASNSCRPEAAAAAAAASCGRGAHSNSSLNGSDWTPNPGIAVSLSLALEQELGSNPFVKLLAFMINWNSDQATWELEYFQNNHIKVQLGSWNISRITTLSKLALLLRCTIKAKVVLRTATMFKTKPTFSSTQVRPHCTHELYISVVLHTKGIY